METTALEAHARCLAQRLSDQALRYDHALVHLADVFEGDDPLELLELIDDAARPLFGWAGRDLPSQAGALAATLATHLELTVETADHRALLLGHALTSGRADPLLLVALGHEIARRAGLNSMVVRSEDRYWTLLSQDGHLLPVGYTHPPGAVDVNQLSVACPHEISFAMLKAITHRAAGDSARIALRARAMLPLRAHGDSDEGEF
jgi:hypothetical protein